MEFLNSDGGKLLLKELRNGDINAFEQIYRRCSAPLYHFVFRYIKSREETEEIVQDVFVQIWSNHEKIRENLPFSHFLFTITKNRIIDYFRKKKVQSLYQHYLQNFADLISENISQDIIYKDLDSYLTKVVNKLPEKRKMVFIMSKKLGMTRSEIADFFDVSENTVKNQLQEAMDFIRISLKKEVSILVVFFSFLN